MSTHAPQCSRDAAEWPAGTDRPQNLDIALLAGLFALAACFVALLWRRWADPLIDVGHQLYTAWRLSEGAVLYRDVDSWYGPLSSHVNALLFRLFGPGITVLVTANLVIYAAVLTAAYLAFARAWGRAGAVAACTVFICIFSFSTLVPINNYTYALPYAHEATHGMLLAFIAVHLVYHWCLAPSRWLGFLAGLALGASLLLKPEFMVAVSVLVAAAWVMRWIRKQPIGRSEVGLFLLGVIIPTALFTLWFLRWVPLGEAFACAGRAWWVILVKPVQTSVPSWAGFVGTDHPMANLIVVLLFGGAAVLAALALQGAGWLADRGAPGMVAGLVLITAIIAFAVIAVPWFWIGQAFPAVVVVILGTRMWRVRASSQLPPKAVMALLLTLLAIAMLARMPLNPRIYHYGFFQAAVAGMVAAAALVAGLRCPSSRLGRYIVRGGAAAILLIACIAIARQSIETQGAFDEPVAAGPDIFYGLNRGISAKAALASAVVEHLRNTTEPDSKVLVVPEGLMINYLSRRASPLPTWIYIEPTLAGRAEERFVSMLDQAPPARVVIVSRDLREHGVPRFGAPGTYGHAILAWIQGHYEVEKAWGGDPLDPALEGAAVLKLKANPEHR